MMKIIISKPQKEQLIISESNITVEFVDDGIIYDVSPEAGILIASPNKLDNITLINPRVSNCASGIASSTPNGLKNLLITGAIINNCEGDGINIPYCWGGRIEMSTVYGCKGWGVNLLGSWNLHCRHVEATQCTKGFQLCKWSTHLLTAQVNTEIDVSMSGLEDCTILEGCYLEDRPINGNDYSGIGLQMQECNNCNVTLPIIQRGHVLSGNKDCNCIFNLQRGYKKETNTYRWRLKPAIDIDGCYGGTYTLNCSVRITNSNVKMVESNRGYFCKSSDKFKPGTIAVQASAANGGRISIGEIQFFPSKKLTWTCLHTSMGGLLTCNKDVLIRTIKWLDGKHRLSDFYLENCI